jgi:hypothetical protein
VRAPFALPLALAAALGATVGAFAALGATVGAFDASKSNARDWSKVAGSVRGCGIGLRGCGVDASVRDQCKHTAALVGALAGAPVLHPLLAAAP